MSAEDIRKITEAVISVVESSDKFETYDWMVVRHLGDNYRVKITNNQKMSTREFLSGYTMSDAAIELENLHEEVGDEVRTADTRDIVRVYRDWAFLNGFKKGEYESPTLYVDDWPDDHGRAVVEQVNDMILTHDSITPQDAFAGLKIAGMIYREAHHNGEGTDTPVDLENADQYIELTERVNDIAVDLVERADETAIGFDWDLLGGTFSTYHELLNEDVYEEMGRRRGRRELFEEVQESELSPNEWFAEHADSE